MKLGKDKPKWRPHGSVNKPQCAFVATINDVDYYTYAWLDGDGFIPTFGKYEYNRNRCMDLYPPYFDGDEVAKLIYNWWSNNNFKIDKD